MLLSCSKYVAAFAVASLSHPVAALASLSVGVASLSVEGLGVASLSLLDEGDVTSGLVNEGEVGPLLGGDDVAFGGELDFDFVSVSWFMPLLGDISMASSFPTSSNKEE